MKTEDKKCDDRLIDCDMLLDNAPVESDDYKVEAQVLDAQIKKNGVNNIAVVAPYGAGKSSAIVTYIKRYRKSGKRSPKYVQISLADFNRDDEQLQSEYKENAIERSILQQLLYSQKKYKLPNSTLNRTNKTRITTLLWYFFWSTVFLFATVALIFETTGNGLFGDWKYIGPILTTLSVVSIVFILVSLLYAGKLRKIKYKDLEVSLDKDGKPQGDVSLINKFIDEVLYFFECINVDLVIFEDLDRFDNLKIFVKLRELNTIINNSPRKAKKVTFVYAVKDTMFKDENQRAKFFEFILPVIPIINPVTVADNIRLINNKLAKKDVSLKLSEQFIKDISYYFDDMRVLKNAFNDFIVMTRKLNDKTGNREKIFALALYKNLYPYDYARLQQNEGLIPLCVDKNRLTEQFIKAKNDDIRKLEDEKIRIKKEILNNFEELKLLFKGQHYKYGRINVYPATSLDSLDSFNGVSVVEHPDRSGYSVTVQKLPSGETYYEREQVIKSKHNNRLSEIDNDIRRIKQEIEGEENDTFVNLIDRIGIDVYFSDENVNGILDRYIDEITSEVESDLEEKLSPSCDEKLLMQQISFIRMLIYKHYIAEDYLEYISNYCSDMSIKDMEFIRNVKRGYMQSYAYKLDDIAGVIKNLNEEDFSQSAVLIKDILNSLYLIKELDKKEEVKTDKFTILMRLLSSGKKSVVKAITEFLALTDSNEKTIFSNTIVQYAESLVEFLFEADISDNDKDIFAKALVRYKKYEILKSTRIKDFIEMHLNYLSLFDGLDYESISELIVNINFAFDKIDLSNGRDKLFEFIVYGNHYKINVNNIKTILGVSDNQIAEFERKNYSFIRNCGMTCVINRVENNINDYIERVYLKLQSLNEGGDVVKELLANEQIKLENKINIITHTDFKLTNFDDVDNQFFSTILNENKVEANWCNIVTAYKSFNMSDDLINFISSNSGVIEGSYSSIDAAIQVEIFNKLIELPYDDEIFSNLAKSIDSKYKMNSTYGKCKNIKPFILAGLFEFNIGDMQFLSNPPSTLPYLICYQDNILSQMNDFFGDSPFKSKTGENIIEERLLSMDFKKKFIELYGSKIDFSGIELKIARFIVYNNCFINENTLYKFTNVNLLQELKLGLLALAIKNNQIKDLVKCREYFSLIGEEYSLLINKGEKMNIENTANNRTIAQFLKDNGICDFSSRKERIYLRSA